MRLIHRGVLTRTIHQWDSFLQILQDIFRDGVTTGKMGSHLARYQLQRNITKVAHQLIIAGRAQTYRLTIYLTQFGRLLCADHLLIVVCLLIVVDNRIGKSDDVKDICPCRLERAIDERIIVLCTRTAEGAIGISVEVGWYPTS